MGTVKILPSGEIFVPCKTKQADPLIEESYNFNAAASATTNPTAYTTTTGRGRIVAFRVVASATSIVDLANLILSISVNGATMVQNVSCSEFSGVHGNSRVYRNIVIPEKAQITAIAVNGASVIIPVAIVFYYQDPYNELTVQDS